MNALHSLANAALTNAVLAVGLATFVGAQTEAQPSPTTSLAPAQVRALATELDGLIKTALDAQQMRPGSIIEDASFLRRSYLQIIGRIPTPAEAREFLDDQTKDKRSVLIETLLNSAGRTSHDMQFWFDLLRIKTRLANQVSGEPYRERVRQAVVNNEAYDDFVHSLLTASGPAHADGNGATGYFLRDRGMPEDNMANTMRIFLGTRIECAQCHDHPFDKWTQRQFYELAAFTGGMTYRQDLRTSEAGQQLQAMQRKVSAEHGKMGVQAFRRAVRGVTSGISGSGTGVAQMPKVTKSDSAKPGARLTAKTPFGPQAAIEVPAEAPRRGKARGRKGKQAKKRQRSRRPRNPEIDSRVAFADWLTQRDNPRFGLVIANRMWKRVMGQGLIEPVDNIKDDTKASMPEVMAFLERLVETVDYDLVAFRRVLLHSKFFQRASSPEGSTVLTGPAAGRLSAEQLWDSMLTFVVDDVDASIGRSAQRATMVTQSYSNFLSMDDAALDKRIETELLRRKDPAKYREMRNSARRAQQKKATAKRKALQARTRPTLRKLARARRKGDTAEVRRLTAKLEADGYVNPSRRINNALVRASELPSPAPDGHFLRQFGQSDREQIEAASTTAAVTQALTLLNGFVESRVLRNDNTTLMRRVRGAKTPQAMIDTAFLAVLSRRPTRNETALWLKDVQGDPNQGIRDLCWTLTNLHEFRFLP